MFSESDILTLREKVKPYLTEKRYSHTLAVEKEAAYLGSIYLPEKIAELRVSALLHDVTKKCDFEKVLQKIRRCFIMTANGGEKHGRQKTASPRRNPSALAHIPFPASLWIF